MFGFVNPASEDRFAVVLACGMITSNVASVDVP
jgi:2-keto-3-deoxy-galactonokinase